MKTLAKEVPRSQKLASYLHGYLLNIYNADGFKRLSDGDLQNPARFARLPCVNNEVSTALHILLRLEGLPEMEPEGLRVDRHCVNGSGGNRVALLLRGQSGELRVLAMFRSDKAMGEDNFRFSPFPVAVWASQELPMEEGILRDTTLRTAWGELRISAAQATISLHCPPAVYSYDAGKCRFSIGYGSGPLRPVLHYHAIPQSFMMAVDWAYSTKNVDERTYRKFTESLDSLPGKAI